MDLHNLNYSDISSVTDYLNDEILSPLIIRYNEEYAPEYLFHLHGESVAGSNPTAFRARMGLLIEYALVTILGENVSYDTDGACFVTFNTTNMFADLFIRGKNQNPPAAPLLRFDIKAFQGSSAEASPRFETLRADIDMERDYLLVTKWDWDDAQTQFGSVIVPKILDSVIVSCHEVALERDQRQILAGGSFDRATGQALARGGLPDTNFGKMNRIVHKSRADAKNLNPYVARLVRMASGSHS